MPGRRDQLVPRHRARALAFIFMAGDERDERAVLAMGQRHAGERRPRNRRGDAGHDLELDLRARERRGLFAAAPENKRIAAFEPHDDAPFARVRDQHRVQLGLLDTFFGAAAFASVNQLGLRRREPDQFRTHEIVVDNDVGAAQNVGAANRDQVGSAGPRADEEDPAAFTLRSIFFPSPCKGEDEGEGPITARIFRARFKIPPL